MLLKSAVALVGLGFAAWVGFPVQTQQQGPPTTSSASIARAVPQDAKKPQDPPKAAEAAGMPVAKALPEHAALAEDVGIWDFTMKMYMEPGKPPTIMKGTHTATLMPGGLWLTEDWKATDGSFHGHLVLGYDPFKKSYRGTWVDSWSMAPHSIDGTHSAEKKEAVYKVVGTGPMGETTIMTETITRPTAKTRKAIFRMDIPGIGDTTIMECESTRR